MGHQKNDQHNFYDRTSLKRTGLQYIFLLFMLCCSFQYSFSQGISVKSSIDKNRILIGEPIRLQLEAFVPEGNNATWFAVDSIPHFEFIEKGKIDTAKKRNGNLYRQLLTITSFDSGQLVVPALSLNVNDRYYLTDSLPVTVAFSDFDPKQEYHDIHDILEIKFPDGKYITWSIAFLTLLSFLAVIYFLQKRSSPVKKAVEKPETRLPPLEEAMLLLEELKKQNLPEKGQVKLYYTGLNDILRSFISQKMKTVTMQKTNEELIVQLRDPALDNGSYILLAQTLRMSDAVKFAKFIPAADENAQSFKSIKTSIELLNNLNK